MFAVIIVNWNGWRDTVACLESLLPGLPDSARVIVCDNASQDMSLVHIRRWADGERRFDHSREGECGIQGAIGYVEYDRLCAERGGSTNDPQLVLVRTGGNLGFAAANNIGLRYGLERGYEFFWLLNNDTIVNEHSGLALVDRMKADPSIGMCGSTLVYLHAPDKVQALGGSRFDFARGVGEHIGVNQPLQTPQDAAVVEKSIDYVVGASMMVSRCFIEMIGYMCEDYFLYYEEIDWAVRANGRFKLGWAPQSIVHHKEGGSIGSSHLLRPSSTSLRYLYRNRLRFAYRHTPNLYWTVWRAICFDFAVYLKRLDFQAARIILDALVRGLSFGRA